MTHLGVVILIVSVAPDIPRSPTRRLQQQQQQQCARFRLSLRGLYPKKPRRAFFSFFGAQKTENKRFGAYFSGTGPIFIQLLII